MKVHNNKNCFMVLTYSFKNTALIAVRETHTVYISCQNTVT